MYMNKNNIFKTQNFGYFMFKKSNIYIDFDIPIKLYYLHNLKFHIAILGIIYMFIY